MCLNGKTLVPMIMLRRKIVSLVSTWVRAHLGRIVCCCVSCRISTAGYVLGIKSRLGADNAVSVPPLIVLWLPPTS